MSSNKDILIKYIEDKNHDTFHTWGDAWFGWEYMDQAIKEMRKYIDKSRVLVYDKEKFGTYRFTILCMYDGTLKSWLQPTVRIDFDWSFNNYWIYKNYPKIYNWVRNKIVPIVNKGLHYISRADRFISKYVPKKFIKKVQNWQLQKLNEGFQKVCLEYPMIVNEMISDIDCPEIIKPYGDYIIDGETIHNKYWKEPFKFLIIDKQ